MVQAELVPWYSLQRFVAMLTAALRSRCKMAFRIRRFGNGEALWGAKESIILSEKQSYNSSFIFSSLHQSRFALHFLRQNT